ncbi:MAG TPA: response regulator transcription factor [Gemmatimonadales bacterium]|nr:response regulator transcription factor [Gemmatimonadales bacterium]
MVSLIIVSGVRLYRDGLAAVLSRVPLLCLQGTADQPADALALLDRCEPDLALVDMATGDCLDTIAALRRVRPNLRIVAVAIEETESEVLQCAEAGVSGFVSCAATADDLIQTVLGVAQGELRCSPRAAAMVFSRLAAGMTQPAAPRASALTSREREVAVLLHQGLSNKQIGEQLHIGVATVKNHLHHIFDKLAVGTRGEAVARLRLNPGRWPRRARRSTAP